MSVNPIARPISLFALCLGFLITAALPTPARAQPLADRVPDDAMIYVGWMGWDDKSPGFQGSHYQAVLEEGHVKQLIDETLPKLLQKLSEKDRNAADAIGIAKPILLPMLKHPTAIFLGKAEFIANQEPKIKAGLICQAGPDANAMFQQIQELMKNAPERVKAMVHVSKTADTVVVAVNYGEGAIPPAGRANLSNSAGFAAMKPHMVANASVALYIDVEQFVGVVNKGLDTYAPPEVQGLWPKIRDAIGIQGLKHLVYSAGFDGKDWADHMLLHAPEPRPGLFALADPKPLSEAALKSIPATATMAGATKFDLGKLVGALRKAVHEVDENAGQQVDEVINEASKHIGLDIQKDVLDALGDEWVYYSDPMTGGRGMFGAVMINHLKNAQKAEASFSKLESMLNDVLAKEIKDKDVSVKFLTTKYGNTTIHYLGTPLVSPAWAVKGEFLIVALYPQMVAGASDQVGAGGKSILDNPKYQAMRQRLGVPNANGFGFADLQQTAPDGYAFWVAVSRLSGFGDIFGVPAPAMLLPPLNKIMPHLAPAGQVTWTDKDGIHAKSISPFPGSQLFASDPLGVMIMMAPSMVMPYMAARRAEAHRADAFAEREQAVQGERRAIEARNAAQRPVAPVTPARPPERAPAPPR